MVMIMMSMNVIIRTVRRGAGPRFVRIFADVIYLDPCVGDVKNGFPDDFLDAF